MKEQMEMEQSRKEKLALKDNESLCVNEKDGENKKETKKGHKRGLSSKVELETAAMMSVWILMLVQLLSYLFLCLSAKNLELSTQVGIAAKGSEVDYRH